MTEKSELDDFKEWLLKKQYSFRDNENHNIPHLRVYYEYEAEQKLKQREEEIRNLIYRLIEPKGITGLCGIGDYMIKRDLANEIYDKLKEKEYLK